MRLGPHPQALSLAPSRSLRLKAAVHLSPLAFGSPR